jgi:hypothetical protein
MKEMIEKYIAASEPRSREYGLLYSAMQYAVNWQKEQSESIRISREKEYLDHIDKRYTEAEVIKLLVQHTAYVLENNTYSIDSEEWFNENKKK